HRLDAELLREPAHRERVDTFFVRNADRGTQHAFLAQRRTLHRDRIGSLSDLVLLGRAARRIGNYGLDNLTLYDTLQRMTADRKSGDQATTAARPSKGETDDHSIAAPAHGRDTIHDAAPEHDEGCRLPQVRTAGAT